MFIFIPYTLFCNTLPRVFGEPSGVFPALAGATASGFTLGIGPGAQGWARDGPWKLQPHSIP